MKNLPILYRYESDDSWDQIGVANSPNDAITGVMEFIKGADDDSHSVTVETRPEGFFVVLGEEDD